MLVERDARLYDFPRYYDLLFGSDWRAEFDFLLGAFELHAARKVRSLFEPACGTGRLLIHFAREGYRVAGNDLNARAVAFCNARLARNGFPASAVVGDMSRFTVTRPVDAAFNTVCVTEASKSGTTFSLADIASGTGAGTYYSKNALGCTTTLATLQGANWNQTGW